MSGKKLEDSLRGKKPSIDEAYKILDEEEEKLANVSTLPGKPRERAKGIIRQMFEQALESKYDYLYRPFPSTKDQPFNSFDKGTPLKTRISKIVEESEVLLRKELPGGNRLADKHIKALAASVVKDKAIQEMSKIHDAVLRDKERRAGTDFKEPSMVEGSEALLDDLQDQLKELDSFLEQ